MNDTAPVPTRPTAGLRANAYAAVVMLLLTYGLGMWVNLYGQLPASDHGAGLLAAFTHAVTRGPIGLSIHAVLGTLLLASAISAVVRAARARRPALIVLAALGLLAVSGAWISGARFVGTDEELSSLSMAIATGVALFAYTTIVLLATPSDQAPGATPLPPAADPETTHEAPVTPAVARGTGAHDTH
jgi:hypothetical protein